MRLAVLGPSVDNSALFRQRAQFALRSLQPDRLIYLGSNDSNGENFANAEIRRWTAELVGEPSSDDGIWQRAARDCSNGSAEQIDRFLNKEKQLRMLRKIEFLHKTNTKLIELMDRLVITLVFDKGILTEEDLFSGSVFVFGASDRPVIKTIGSRVFLCPGPMDHAQAGLLLLHQRHEKTIASWYDRNGNVSHEAPVTTSKVRAKLSVQGSEP